MDTIDESRVIIQPLNPEWYQHKVAALDMLRLDLLHPVISGNKWYKLRLNIKHAQENGQKAIVTFGGGYSNHLVATAYACKLYGIKATGIVRGNYEVLTPTLVQCREEGMELIFVSQEEYKNKQDGGWINKLVASFDELLIIPEGGANEWGRAGAGLINRFVKDTYTHVAVAVGTGTTLIGLRNKINERQQILGFAPMRQGLYLKDYISEHIQEGRNKDWQLFDNWHLGGFGKWNDELITFMNDFYYQNNIPLDVVYTSKMMYGVRDMLAAGDFDAGARILCVHSGGLQGNASVKDKLNY